MSRVVNRQEVIVLEDRRVGVEENVAGNEIASREPEEKLTGKFSFVGAGFGLALFAVFGLLPGAFLGGAFGLNIADIVFGIAIEPTLLPRAFVVVGMLTGVMVTGFLFMAGGASLGWLLGLVAESIVGRHSRSLKAAPVVQEKDVD